jgi:hypothetical protein
VKARVSEQCKRNVKIKGAPSYALAAALAAAYLGRVKLKYLLPSTRSGATMNCAGARVVKALDAMLSCDTPLLVLRMRLSLMTAIARCALIMPKNIKPIIEELKSERIQQHSQRAG